MEFQWEVLTLTHHKHVKHGKVSVICLDSQRTHWGAELLNWTRHSKVLLSVTFKNRVAFTAIFTSKMITEQFCILAEVHLQNVTFGIELHQSCITCLFSMYCAHAPSSFFYPSWKHTTVKHFNGDATGREYIHTHSSQFPRKRWMWQRMDRYCTSGWWSGGGEEGRIERTGWDGWSFRIPGGEGRPPLRFPPRPWRWPACSWRSAWSCPTSGSGCRAWCDHKPSGGERSRDEQGRRERTRKKWKKRKMKRQTDRQSKADKEWNWKMKKN